MRLLPGAVLGALLVSSAHAQGRAEGHIVRVVGADTIPVPATPVVLHRVGTRLQGPVDTVLTDRLGHFRFRFSPDTTAAFLLSARYAGIEYFSRPVGAGAAPLDTAITVIVADTSSTVPVTVRQRTLLISRPDESGTRLVLDWLVLSNPGPLTRVPVDSVHPSWAGPLPEAAQNVELADNRLSQFAPEVLAFRRDSALIFAPFSPGDKELMLQYRIPGTLRRFVLPAAVTDSVFVLLEESGARVAIPRLTPTDSQTIEGRGFHRWAGLLSGADSIAVVLDGPRFSATTILILLVTAAALGFAILAVRVVRTRRRQPSLPPLDPGALAASIARLDARYAGHQAETPSDEWDRYQADRAGLKAQLEAALARGGRRS